MERSMNIFNFRSDQHYLVADIATHLLARSDGPPALSLLLAGPGLLRRRFAPDTRPNAPSGASNYRF